MNRLRFLLGTLAAVFALVASTANAQPTLQASSQDGPVRISAELTMHDATSGLLTSNRAADVSEGAGPVCREGTRHAERTGIDSAARGGSP